MDGKIDWLSSYRGLQNLSWDSIDFFLFIKLFLKYSPDDFKLQTLS
jgi:hypothetical protein